MDYYNIAGVLCLSGVSSAFSGMTVICASFLDDNIYYNDIYHKMFASSIVCGAISYALSISLNQMGQNQEYKEAISYVQTLSTEELEALSEDLVSANISDFDIEDELSDRLNILSENDGVFSFDEEREALQKSLADYLKKLSNTDYEEYKMVLDTLSDGVYEDGEVVKIEVVKKLNL